MLPLDVIKRRIIVHNSTQDEYDPTPTTSPAAIMVRIKAGGQSKLFSGYYSRAAVKMKI